MPGSRREGHARNTPCLLPASCYSQERLEKLRLELSEQYGKELRDVPILIGDLQDQASRRRAGRRGGACRSRPPTPGAPCERHAT